MRRSFKRRSRRGSTRRKDWQSNSNFESVPGTIAPGTLLLASQWVAPPADTFGQVPGANDQIEQEEDNTVVRLMASTVISVSTSGVVAPATPGGVVFFGAGILVWEQNTQDIPNPLEIPNPIVDADADWLWQWNTPIDLSGLGNNALLVRTNTISSTDVQMSSRAKRKLSSKRGLLYVAMVDNSFGLYQLSGFSYAYWSRFLVLLA